MYEWIAILKNACNPHPCSYTHRVNAEVNIREYHMNNGNLSVHKRDFTNTHTIITYNSCSDVNGLRVENGTIFKLLLFKYLKIND